jgi:hypothetical protein
MKVVSLLLVSFISNNLLPEADILLKCVTLIQKLRTVDEKEYYTCRSWSKTDVHDKELIGQAAVVVQSVTRKSFAENGDAVSNTMDC